ncbi:MAG TPA: TolC family protein, partial [Bdellovibrio sp.]|nr:TolC family protein [Bdellovibrio sp.]
MILRGLRQTLACLMIFFLLGTSFAATPTAPAPAPTPTAPIKINADTLKTMLLEQNISLMIQLNKVYQAKEQIALHRAQLLPSINLGTMISSGPSFALATVNMLLPFLLPSNWFDLKESQYLLNAQATSYYIAQLNTYSSAYAVYMTVVGDMDLRDVLYQQYLNYKDIEDQIQLAVDAGMMQPSDLLQAKAQTELAAIQVSQVEDLLQREKSSLREMLALPLTQDFVIEKNHLSSTTSETLPAQVLLDKATAKAPELNQLASMISAAKTAKWSKAFSFLSGSSLSSTRSNGALSPISQIGTVNLGFGYFPSLKIADYNIDELQLQKKQVTLDQAQVIESTLGSLVQASKQYDLAAQAEANLDLVYQGELEKFRAGMTDLLHVLSAGNNLTTALTNKVKA